MSLVVLGFAAAPASASCTDDFVAGGPGTNPGPFEHSPYYATGYVHQGPGTVVIETGALTYDVGQLQDYELGRVTNTVALTTAFVNCVAG